MKSPITTHVLDTSRGRPAEGVPIRLEVQEGDSWRQLAADVTNSDGRVAALLEPGSLRPATYRITFDTAAYFEAQKVEGFYPYAQVVFTIRSLDQHYHVPLLLNPFGYSTYRGS